MWREALYAKLQKVGFGGKTLSLIKSMYRNDCIKFLINGHYSAPLWLTQGVKQGKLAIIIIIIIIINTYFIVGCNLSPLLFSIFINDLGQELNLTGCGLTLSALSISSIFFADDIVLVSRDKQGLDKLIMIAKRFCDNHHLQISATKSKIMSHDAATGHISFNIDNDDTLSLDQVLAFKYLGITVSSKPYGLFKAHNENVKAKAKQYLYRVLSLVKTGPDRSDLAFTLWRNVALPAILYGCEVVPLNQDTIQEIERCQARVGKFMLQIPSSSANVCTYIDCGFRPIWAIIAERVLTYANKTMCKPSSNWAKLAFEYHLGTKPASSYLKYLIKWKDATQTFGVHPKQVEKNVKYFAIQDIINSKNQTSTTAFPLSCPGISKNNRWFRPKPWVKDSGFTKIFAEFRTCNAGLGNRGPTKDGRFYKLCPLCSTDETIKINNEVFQF